MLHRLTRIFVGTSALVTLTSFAGAVPVFSPNSSVVITHIADRSNLSLGEVSTTVKPPPAVFPPSFQLAHEFVTPGPGGTSHSNADASVAEVTSAVTTTIRFVPGTGVTQNNVPGHAYTGASALTFDINALWFNPTQYPAPGQFHLGFASFPVSGVVGVGGQDRIIVNLTYRNGVGGALLGTLSLDQTFPNATALPLPFFDLATKTTVLNAGQPLPAGSQVLITGSVELRAKNEESPSEITLDTGGDIGTMAIPLPPAWATALGGMGLILGLARVAPIVGRRRD